MKTVSKSTKHCIILGGIFFIALLVGVHTFGIQSVSATMPTSEPITTPTPVITPAKNVPKWIIVHHTAGTQSDTFEDVNRWHKERWPNFVSALGYHIGYHYFIDATGSVTQGRAETEEGAHTIGKNTESIGICLAGNFSRPGEIPTEEQERKLVELVQEIQKRWNIPNENIVPHRKFAATECYGKNLDDNWVQSLLRKYEATPTPEEPEETSQPEQSKLNPIQEVLEKIIDIIDKIRSLFGF